MDKQKLLEDADTEDKVKRLKKWYGCICTRYVLKSLIRSLCSCLKITPVLSYVELEGLLISGEYLQLILKGISSNKTLKYISFKSCPIEDEGCFEICETLHSLPNIEVLNLSSCSLSKKSGEYIAKLIKYQQINRYCESWHSSLRYEEPEVNNMAGIRRITINNNPKVGDEGLELILNELIDDLWIKAIDMQRCNITEAVAGKIIDTLEYNRSLEVVDFRNNNLDVDTITKILEILKTKQSDEPVFQWCQTTTSLGSTAQILGNLSAKVTPQMSKTSNKIGIKRQTTMPFLPRKSESQKEVKENINNSIVPDNQSLIKAKEQLMKLYEKLREETLRRQTAETKCEELQKQVDELIHLQKNQMILKEFTNMKSYINKFIKFIQQNGRSEEHTPIIQDLQNALEEVQVLSKPYEKLNKPMDNSKNEDEIFSKMEQDKETSNFSHLATDVHALFENLTGKPIDDDEDFGINLDLSPRLQQSSSSYTTDTSRSTDSESVETMKRLLEELSQEDRSSTLDELSELSRSSQGFPVKEKQRLNLKIPQTLK